MANPNQQQQGQKKPQNPLFGSNYIQKYCLEKWNEWVGTYAPAVETVLRQTSDIVRYAMSKDGPGIVYAIAQAKEIIAKLVQDQKDDFRISQEACDAILPILDALKDAIQKEQAEQAEKKGKPGPGRERDKVQWSLPPTVSPTVRSVDEFLAGMPGRQQQSRRQQISALDPVQRQIIDARLAQGLTKQELGQLISSMSR